MLVSLAYEPFASRKLSPAEGGCKTLILSFGRLKGFVELIERRLSYPKIRDLCRGNLKRLIGRKIPRPWIHHQIMVDLGLSLIVLSFYTTG